MSLKETLGFGSDKKVRYAIVGAGWISQAALLPGVKHTGNSEVTAFITGDPAKARELQEKYHVENSWNYDGYDEALKSGTFDAIYLALPNWQHAEFAVKALDAGIHVLLEKPIEINEERGRQIADAAGRSQAKLMIAYRLHFEPGTLHLLKRVRSGEFGSVHLFTSTFAQRVSPENHRAQSGYEAGPVLDMGPYPINAVRNIFGAEPEEVFALGVRHPDAGLGKFDDTVAVTLRFPGNRLAQFTVSYYGNPIDEYLVVGEKGWARACPGYMFGKANEFEYLVGEKDDSSESTETDHFGGELKYFSDCILTGADPEPDAEEGLLDVRVSDAIRKSLETGEKVKLEPRERRKQIDVEAQVVELSPVSPPKLVDASKPDQG